MEIILNIPDVLCFHILPFLKVKDLLSIKLVSKQFRQFSKMITVYDRVIWNQQKEQEFKYYKNVFLVLTIPYFENSKALKFVTKLHITMVPIFESVNGENKYQPNCIDWIKNLNCLKDLTITQGMINCDNFIGASVEKIHFNHVRLINFHSLGKIKNLKTLIFTKITFDDLTDRINIYFAWLKNLYIDYFKLSIAEDSNNIPDNIKEILKTILIMKQNIKTVIFETRYVF